MAEKNKLPNVKKLREKVNPLKEEMKRYPLVKVRPKDTSKIIKRVKEDKKYDLMLGTSERMILKLTSLALKFERKIPFIRSYAMKIMKSIRDDVVKAYMPIPAYSYAVLIASSIFFSTLMIPFFFLFLFLKIYILAFVFLMLILTVYVFAGYLYMAPKRKFSGIRGELLQLLGIWYGVSTTGMSPQEQFETIYEILREYRRLNLKYGSLYPKFKLFDLFYDIHYSMKYKNLSVVDAVENVIAKVEDETLKLFFMKVLRAIKEQNDLAPVIESEYMRLIREVEQDIEKSGDMVSMMSEVYVTIVSMFAGNLLILMVVMGSLTSFTDAIHSLFMGITMSTIVVLLVSLAVGGFINIMFSSKKPTRKVPYNPLHAVISFFTLILVIILPFITTISSPLYLFFPAILGIILSFPGLRDVKRLKKQIRNAELDFAHRLHEVATQLSFGQMLPDAMLSTVLRVNNQLATFLDWLFYTIANYLKFGRTMRDLIEPIIVKIPSNLIRIPLTVIALVEEKAGKMDGVFENMAVYVSNIIEASLKVRALVAQLRMMSVFINIMSLGIMAYLLVQLLPSQLAVPISNAMQGGSSSQNFDIHTIGQSYITQYRQISPLLYTIQNRLFPQTLTDKATSVTVTIGMVGMTVFLFSMAFAMSTAIFLVMLDDNPTLPEFTFYFSLFLLIMLLIGYQVVFSKVYNYESFEKSLKIVQSFEQLKNTTAQIQ